ncbi:MAG: hypothetical protein JXK05_08605 [Campylobacterales bacterium]|nr:hypothetical protein [Campylobacterales bacterium]
MNQLYIAALLALLALSGCSSKGYYKPEQVEGTWKHRSALSSPIVEVNSDAALLEDGKILTRNEALSYTLPQEYRLVGVSDGRIIGARIDGSLILADRTGEVKTFTLGKTVAAASVAGDHLAVLFANNEKAIYSVATAQQRYKEIGSPVTALDGRIANPYFLNDLVLFLTLDGKIDIVNTDSLELLRSIIVSSEEHFNNIIYFNVVDEILFAATSYRVLSLAEQEMRASYELRDVIFTKEGVWLSTKQGEVIALTPSLTLKAKKKFPFAHFLEMALHGEKLYLLEREGYLLEMSTSLEDLKVYEVDIDDGFVFASKEAIFVNDQRILLSE